MLAVSRNKRSLLLVNQKSSPIKEEGSPGFYYGYIIILASFLIFFIAGGAQYSFGVFLKPVLTEFGWTRAAISGAYSLNNVLMGLLSILAGRLSDRFGPRSVLTISGLLLGLGYLLMSQVNAIWQIYLFFGVLVGIGMGGIAAPLMSSVARWFVKGRGLASGIVISGAGVGITIIPPLANLLISNYSWRFSYIIIGIIVVSLPVVIAQFLRRPPNQMNTLSQDANKLAKDSLNLQSQGFSLQEVIRTRQFWIISLISLSNAFGVQTIMVHLVAHATDINISSTAAATLLSVIGIVSIGSKVIMGAIGDKFGYRKIIIMVFILMSLSFLWLSFSGELWTLYLFAVVLGFNYGAYSGVHSPLVAKFFGLKEHGAILGLTLFALNFGGAVGPLAAGQIFDISGSYSWAFALCAILGLASLAMAVIMKPLRR